MDLKKTLTVTGLSSATDNDIRRIAQVEGRSKTEVARLLIKAGLRIYRRSGSLLCGYPNCSRKTCCGGENHGGAQVLEFRQLRLLDGSGPEH
ncbi:MAG: hypothetical protein M3547_01110 [Acidobacteriota bacterium]|nr:hypothetical protein [Acidobacteriota bacterium]